MAHLITAPIVPLETARRLVLPVLASFALAMLIPRHPEPGRETVLHRPLPAVPAQ